MKAILEIDVPESCIECKFNTNPLGIWQQCRASKCETIDKKLYSSSRAPFCPLKIVPDEYEMLCNYCKHFPENGETYYDCEFHYECIKLGGVFKLKDNEIVNNAESD